MGIFCGKSILNKRRIKQLVLVLSHHLLSWAGYLPAQNDDFGFGGNYRVKI
jgi:hypothetical protein